MSSKVLQIAYELKNLWSYLTRQELSEYYGISERTLFTYSKKLNLPKKVDRNVVPKVGTPVHLWVNTNDRYEEYTFKNWEHFATWQKAQPRNIYINSMVKDGKTYITCDFLGKKQDAINYESQLGSKL